MAIFIATVAATVVAADLLAIVVVRVEIAVAHLNLLVGRHGPLILELGPGVNRRTGEEERAAGRGVHVATVIGVTAIVAQTCGLEESRVDMGAGGDGDDGWLLLERRGRGCVVVEHVEGAIVMAILRSLMGTGLLLHSLRDLVGEVAVDAIPTFNIALEEAAKLLRGVAAGVQLLLLLISVRPLSTMFSFGRTVRCITVIVLKPRLREGSRILSMRAGGAST